jgi:hypothetical protein
MLVVTAGSGAGKIHVSSWNMCDSPKVNAFCALSKERVYDPIFFMETTITGIVYPDMPQQYLIPQTMTKKDAFTSSKTAHPFITLEKCTGTSAPVGGLVERRRQNGHGVSYTPR